MSILNKNHSAFTLIELLVVIAIIGILSSVVLSSLSGARESAKVTRTVSDLEQIETAMIMWMQRERKVQWPPETSFGDGSNPSISQIANETNLSNYINSIPTPPTGSSYFYDYQIGENYTGCGDTIYDGVVIGMHGISDEVKNKIDKIIDGKLDLSCGRFTGYSGGDSYYRISNDGTL